mgnify:CR=1 FL=1
MPVITGACKYPEGIVETLKEKAEVISLDALGLSMSLGSSKAVNVVLIGLMAKSTDIPYDVWKKAVTETVPPKFLEVNLRAFDLGYNH